MRASPKDVDSTAGEINMILDQYDYPMRVRIGGAYNLHAAYWEYADPVKSGGDTFSGFLTLGELYRFLRAFHRGLCLGTRLTE